MLVLRRRLVVSLVLCVPSGVQWLSSTQGDGDDSAKASKSLPFIVDDSAVFNRLMLFCLRSMHTLFDTMLQRGEKTPPYAKDRPRTGACPIADRVWFSTVLPDKARRWKGLQPLAKSYLTSVLRFLQQLSHPSMIGACVCVIELCTDLTLFFCGCVFVCV
jgi:hypothetical protein